MIGQDCARFDIFGLYLPQNIGLLTVDVESSSPLSTSIDF